TILTLEKNPGKLEDYIEHLRSEKGVQATFVTPNQKIQSGEGRQILQNIEYLENEIFHVVKIPKIGNTQLIYKETLSDGKILILRTSLALVSTYRNEMNIFNVITTIISILLSGIICYIFSKAFVKDIKTLNTSAQMISNLKFLDRIEINREDEIGDLSRSIQQMSQNLQESMENLNSFVSDASHELKTPLTVIDTSVQTLLKNRDFSQDKERKNLEIISLKVQELNSLLVNLLNLSKVKSLGYALEEKELSLSSLISQSLEKYEDLELEKDIQVLNKIGEEKILGDEKLLKIALDNIIQNAFKYSPYGENLDITVVNRVLKISNSLMHKPLSPDQLWEPFKRDSKVKKMGIEGSGLGLSIVKRALQVSKKEFGIEIDRDLFIFFIKL
ncbi:MAG: HAMP domain-containing sensor histidine kinase, partial [Fusobacteriaceae bacterium]